MRRLEPLDLPNFSMLVTVLTNHFGRLSKLAEESGSTVQNLQHIENKRAIDPRYSVGMRLIELSKDAFGPEKTKQYLETR